MESREAGILGGVGLGRDSRWNELQHVYKPVGRSCRVWKTNAGQGLEEGVGPQVFLFYSSAPPLSLPLFLSFLLPSSPCPIFFSCNKPPRNRPYFRENAMQQFRIPGRIYQMILTFLHTKAVLYQATKTGSLLSQTRMGWPPRAPVASPSAWCHTPPTRFTFSLVRILWTSLNSKDIEGRDSTQCFLNPLRYLGGAAYSFNHLLSMYYVPGSTLGVPDL